MSPLRLILASLFYHRRINLAVALGVAAATAVLTGALVVGDSMRGSLRHLVVDRLGKIDSVLVVNGFFRAELAGEIAASPDFDKHFTAALPAIMLRATVENPAGDSARAGKVNVLGTGERFWDLGSASDPVRPTVMPQLDEVVLNGPLAAKLGVKIGQDVIVRLPRQSTIPADSPLGRKTETLRSRQLTVVAIVPARGLGRFDMRSNQRSPLNAYASLETVQTMLYQDERINAIFVAGKSIEKPVSTAAQAMLKQALRPTLADYGLSIEHVKSTFEKETVFDYYHLTSKRMLLPPVIDRAAMAAWQKHDPRPALTYLANYIQTAGGKAKIPYSTVTAIDPDDRFGPLLRTIGGQKLTKLSGEWIVLNGWADDDMKAQGDNPDIGSPITLTFFEPESTHGKIQEISHTFRLAAVVPLATPDERPMPANDPNLTPEVPGVTDQQSIDDWNPPFPYDDSRVRSSKPNDQDEEYWKHYKATPKAFVSLAAGRRLWKSRFGQTTSIRIPPVADLSADVLTKQLLKEIDPAAAGFVWRHVKQTSLEAASGSTPFEGLFLGFSMFIIVAAVMLVMLLFRLDIEQRANQIGILLAVGLSRRRTTRLMTAEGVLVSAFGGAIGAALGVGYGQLMITGLTVLWIDAISAPFLELHWTITSLAVGYASGVIASALTIGLSLRQLRQVSERDLLAGNTEPPSTAVARRTPIAFASAVGMFALAILLGVAGFYLEGEVQAGAFMGCGAMVLGGSLAWIWTRFHAGSARPLVGSSGSPLLRLAVRNGARNPTRSTLTIGLVGSASFLIVAISAFRLDPSGSGAGGFDLIAETSQAVNYDLNTPAGRRDLGFSDSDSKQLAGAEIFSLRIQGGDDASCLNLYQSSQPRVLGVSEAMIGRGQFAWASSTAESDKERKNPWLLLNRPAGVDSAVVPVILDMNTAMYSLHKSLGDEIEIDDSRGGTIRCRIVALLKNSIFQGDLLMSEAQFVSHFRDVSGYRMFVIDTPAGKTDQITKALSRTLSDEGFSATTTRERLADLFAVQNTYLSTFQSLGALGLLLGTFGLATVQLRNVFERRGELALLRAIGFRRAVLARMVLLENAILLAGGMAVGLLAALLAVLPHYLAGGAAVPYLSLGGMLAAILAVGFFTGLLAVRATVQTPLLAALRGE